MEKNIFPTIGYIESFDKSKWKIFHLSLEVVVTSSGQKLLRMKSELLCQLHEYREDIRTNRYNVIHYFRSGGNSDVYDLSGTSIVIKEALPGNSAWSILNSMDKLYYLCREALYPLVRAPEHYGLISCRQLPCEYLIMQKTNDGLTVEEVREMPSYQQYIKLINYLFKEVKNKITKLSDI